MYTVTYSLRDINNTDSEHYYLDIESFTDEVILEMNNLTSSTVKEYIAYSDGKPNWRIRSKEEYGFELLVLGILWKIYSGDALGLNTVPRQMLTGLAKLREQGGRLKPGIDFIRGIMATIFLSPDLYDNMFILDPTLEQMEKLLNWLDATGEFDREVKRLRNWQEYLAAHDSKEVSDIIATTITLAAWFEIRSEEVLGRYTSNVERYLNEIRTEHYWHEDVIFCGRRRAEYHMNMVGAEIMNRAYKKAFAETKHKLVMLPACMRLLPADKCKAVEVGVTLQCVGCTEGCSVNKLRKLGIEEGFKISMISHESSISATKTDKATLSSNTGVVGIACVLNLISGGWMLDDKGIPAQCVLLDYCGCKNHWSREGIPTEINFNRLKKILNCHIECKN